MNNKTARLMLALFVLPLLVPLVRAGTGYEGFTTQQSNVTQLGGNTLATGAGSSTSGTQRVILASDSPAGNVTNAGVFPVQVSTTAPIGGVFLTSPPTLSNGSTQQMQLDNKGNQLVNVNAALPAGSALIGKVGIDQTTPGTTNAVVASIAAAQTIAATNAGTFAVQNTAATPAGSSNIGTVSGSTVAVMGSGRSNGVPTQAAVGATTSSAQLVAGNANRVSIEIDADCTNTDRVFLNWGSASATNTMKRIEPCSSWQPPVVSTVALQVLANSGTQNVRVIEYNNQ